MGLTTLLGSDSPGYSCCGGKKKKEKKESIFSKWCVLVPRGLDSLSSTSEGLIFPWVSPSEQCSNISAHMVLIILYIFSAVPFTSIFQPEGLNLSDL